MIRFADIAQPKPAPVAKPARLTAAREAMAETKPPKAKRAKPAQSNAALESNSPVAFDKKAYQRDLMRKRRANAKQKAKA